jgi:hypothetical protein
VVHPPNSNEVSVQKRQSRYAYSPTIDQAVFIDNTGKELPAKQEVLFLSTHFSPDKGTLNP